MSQIKKGAMLNYITIFLTNAVGLFLTPFILNNIGNSQYGIYTTIGALVGTISVLDLGLNNTIIRFVAKYKAEENKKSEENFLATTMILYGIISTLIIIIGYLFYGHIDSYFTKLDSEEIEIAKTIFILLIFNIAIGLPGGSFVGICYGYEVFIFPKTINIIRYILRTIVVVAVLSIGGKAIALVIIDTVFNILFISTEAYYVFFKLKIKIKLHEFKIKYIKQIFSYSIWIFVFSIVIMLNWKAGHWILGRIATPEVLTIYGIGIVLGSYYGAFSSAISSLFLPKAMTMTVEEASNEELTSMMIKIARISFIILMYILCAYALFGNQFVFLWVGKEIGKNGTNQIWLIGLIIMLAYTVPLIQGFANSILEARNKIAFKAILNLSFMIVGAIIGGVLSKSFGALGMLSGTILGWVIVQNIMNFYYHNVIGLNMIRFFKELFKKTIFIIFIILFISYFLNFIPGKGWVNFITKCILYTFIYSSLIYSLGILEFEKKLINNILIPFINKLKSIMIKVKI